MPGRHLGASRHAGASSGKGRDGFHQIPYIVSFLLGTTLCAHMFGRLTPRLDVLNVWPLSLQKEMVVRLQGI